MSMKNLFFVIGCLLSLALGKHKCIHDEQRLVSKILSVSSNKKTYQEKFPEGRSLSSVSLEVGSREYNNIRIVADYSGFLLSISIDLIALGVQNIDLSKKKFI